MGEKVSAAPPADGWGESLRVLPVKREATRTLPSSAACGRQLPPKGKPLRTGGSFSLRAKSRLRRLRSDTRLRAQPLGEAFRADRSLLPLGEKVSAAPPADG